VSGALKELKKGIEANATLAAVYNSGIPIGVELDLGTLDARLAGVKIPPTTPLKTFIDQQFVPLLTAGLNASTESYDAAVKTAEDTKFQKGLGDVEIGAKYALSTVNDPWFDGVPFYTSVAGGVRLNSSKYEEAKKKGEKEVGRGTMDGAIRLNADYEPLNGVQLQLENQTEFMLAKGKTWTATEAKAGKKVDFERDGMRQLGYSKLVIAPGTWIDGADFLMLNARYSWNNDAATKTDGKKDTGSAIYGRTAIAGVSFDGLKLKLPVQLDYDRVLSARSRNVEYASDAHVVTLKLFYKF
jgi:hypothetical protein